MKKTSATLLAVPLAASMLVLSGCGDNTKPTTSTSSPTQTSSPTTTISTTPASPTTSASRPTDPNIPAAARAHTPAGAEAFVKYFHDQLNVAWHQPRAGLLSPLSLPGCKTCKALEDNATDMVKARRHMLGDTVHIESVSAGATDSNGDQTVVITGAQLKTKVVDSTGKAVRDIPAGRIRSLATARWIASGWNVVEIKVIQ